MEEGTHLQDSRWEDFRGHFHLGGRLAEKIGVTMVVHQEVIGLKYLNAAGVRLDQPLHAGDAYLCRNGQFRSFAGTCSCVACYGGTCSGATDASLCDVTYSGEAGFDL